MSTRRLVDSLTEVIARDIPPAHFTSGSEEGDIEQASKSPFTAYSHAIQVNRHHPKLWQAVKGSPFEKQYVKKFQPAG
jgi:hypothetical protein